MEQLKEYLKSPKKTTILGLIGGILMLISIILRDDISYVLNNIYVLGTIIYFVIICMRLYKNIGNVKVANYTLILTYCISAIVYLYDFIRYIPNFFFTFTTLVGLIFEIAQLLIVILSLIFLCNVLFQKFRFITNNILFVIAIFNFIKIICYFVLGYNLLNVFVIFSLVEFFGYLLIIPYFYNYYNILKGENKNGK